MLLWGNAVIEVVRYLRRLVANAHRDHTVYSRSHCVSSASLRANSNDVEVRELASSHRQRHCLQSKSTCFGVDR